MLLAYSTSPEVTDRLTRSRTIVIPIGSQEQHGPTGLLGTDWMCPEVIAHAAHVEGDLLVSPTFNIGMAQHHLAFPGTISLRPSTFQSAIGDWASSLTVQGFDRLYFLNGHGGNIASIQAAFSEIYAGWSFRGLRAPCMLMLRNWWELEGVEALAKRQFPLGHGSHATPSEIAITLAASPEHAKLARYAPQIASTGPVRDALDFRARFPDGRMGSDPGQATVEAGAALIAAARSALIEDVRAFSSERQL